MLRTRKSEPPTAVLDDETLEAPAPAPADPAQPPVLSQYLSDGHPNPDAMSVWEFMQLLTEDQWNEYLGYLYRVTPKRAPTDNPKYLICFTTPLTVEEIKRRYGGKKYTLLFNRRVGSRQKQIYKTQFDIEAEPIWQDGEDPLDPPKPSAAAAAQEGTAQLYGLFEKLLGDVLKQRDQASQEGRGFNVGEAFKEALATQRNSAEQAIAFVREQSKSEGSGMVGMLTTLVEKLLEKKESPLESKLLDKLLERAFGEGQQKEAGDPLEQIERVLNIADRLKGGGRRGGTDWAEVVVKGLDALPQLLSGAKELIQSAASARGIQAPPPGMAGARPTATAPVAVLPAAAPPPAKPNGAAPPAQPAEPGALTEEMASIVIQNRVKQMLVEKLFAGEAGDAAAEVADAMHRPFAEHLALVLKTDPTQLAGDEILKRATTHPNCMEFAKEFCAYFEEEGAEPAAPAAAPTPGTAVN